MAPRLRREVPRVLAAVACLLLVAGCAAGPNPEVGRAVVEGGQPAGFWLGLWHGVIAPVTFVISLFGDGVNVYEVRNSGNWYDAGFVLGLTISIGGSGGASKR